MYKHVRNLRDDRTRVRFLYFYYYYLFIFFVVCRFGLRNGSGVFGVRMKYCSGRKRVHATRNDITRTCAAQNSADASRRTRGAEKSLRSVRCTPYRTAVGSAHETIIIVMYCYCTAAVRCVALRRVALRYIKPV